MDDVQFGDALAEVAVVVRDEPVRADDHCCCEVHRVDGLEAVAFAEIYRGQARAVVDGVQFKRCEQVHQVVGLIDPPPASGLDQQLRYE